MFIGAAVTFFFPFSIFIFSKKQTKLFSLSLRLICPSLSLSLVTQLCAFVILFNLGFWILIQHFVLIRHSVLSLPKVKNCLSLCLLYLSLSLFFKSLSIYPPPPLPAPQNNCQIVFYSVHCPTIWWWIDFIIIPALSPFKSNVSLCAP